MVRPPSKREGSADRFRHLSAHRVPRDQDLQPVGGSAGFFLGVRGAPHGIGRSGLSRLCIRLRNLEPRPRQSRGPGRRAGPVAERDHAYRASLPYLRASPFLRGTASGLAGRSHSTAPRDQRNRGDGDRAEGVHALHRRAHLSRVHRRLSRPHPGRAGGVSCQGLQRRVGSLRFRPRNSFPIPVQTTTGMPPPPLPSCRFHGVRERLRL